MTPATDIAVPALTLLDSTGAIDHEATRQYAKRAAATWTDYFILSGSTTRGQDLTPGQRANILDLWLDITGPDRLLACCWEPADFGHAVCRGITPMATMRHLDGPAAVLAFLQNLPVGSCIYSHPMFGGSVFDAELAAAASRAGILPAGGKIAKITTPAITEVCRAAGDGFRLWDGSSRRIQASLDAGAAGVIATPLCAFDTHLPAKQAHLIQAAVDPVQADLDALPDRPARTAELLRRAKHFGFSLRILSHVISQRPWKQIDVTLTPGAQRYLDIGDADTFFVEFSLTDSQDVHNQQSSEDITDQPVAILRDGHQVGVLDAQTSAACRPMLEAGNRSPPRGPPPACALPPPPPGRR
jgi:dihydrodipicolinate synthase/N-acetylneuraminate lyase